MENLVEWVVLSLLSMTLVAAVFTEKRWLWIVSIFFSFLIIWGQGMLSVTAVPNYVTPLPWKEVVYRFFENIRFPSIKVLLTWLIFLLGSLTLKRWVSDHLGN